jgi:hypothetical protein
LIFDIAVIVELAELSPLAAAGRAAKFKVIHPGHALLLRDVKINIVITLLCLPPVRLNLLAQAFRADGRHEFCVGRNVDEGKFGPIATTIRTFKGEGVEK